MDDRLLSVLRHSSSISKLISSSSDAPYYSPNKLLNKLYEERVGRYLILKAPKSQTSAGAEVTSPQAHSVVKTLILRVPVFSEN